MKRKFTHLSLAAALVTPCTPPSDPCSRSPASDRRSPDYS